MSNRKKAKGHVTQDEPDENSMWIATEPTLDGTSFMVTIRIGQDRSFALTVDEAHAHARKIMDAVAIAEYDAAVVAQLKSIGKFEDDDIMAMLNDFRADRPPYDNTGTEPFEYLPGLGRTDMRPALLMKVEGKAWGSLDPERAKRHALGLIEATTAADLDAAYLRMLRGVVGVPEGTARGMVADLANHR